MKKILFLVLIIIIILSGVYLVNDADIITSLMNGDKEYKIDSEKRNSIEGLGTNKLFNDGIITYSGQKIKHMDYDNNLIWEKDSSDIINNIYISDRYIYICSDTKIEVIDYNNKSLATLKIQGQLLNVSRENNRTCIISKNSEGTNTLNILGENYEVITENKTYNSLITNISIDDKGKNYCLSTISYENNKIKSSIYFNSIQDNELWVKELMGETIISIKIANDNIIVVGINSIYCYGYSGELLWKNNNYSRIKDIIIQDDKMYILYQKEDKQEFTVYNLEGKVKEIYKLDQNVDQIKMYNKKYYLFTTNSINVINEDKLINMWSSDESIIDFSINNNNIYILLKDKLIKGKIK